MAAYYPTYTASTTAVPIEFDPGTSGGGEESVRPDATLEDILFAHRYTSQLMPRGDIVKQVHALSGKPISAIPIDIIRQQQRHQNRTYADLLSVIVSANLIRTLPIVRKWF